MITANQLSVLALFLILVFVVVLNILDFSKKRGVKFYPFISFLVPCYNDGDSIEETINSIYRSYKGREFEVIIINDKSTDNSLATLKLLKRKYGFRILNNEKNLGVAESVNRAAKIAKGPILWRIDSDVMLNKAAVNDVLARMQFDDKIVALSCPYRIINKGFLGRMQELEVNMMALLTSAQNPHSAVSLWGGCIAIKKEAFEKAGGFSQHMLTEDLDLAYKLNGLHMKVEQSPYMVSAYSSDNLRSWYSQKIRWVSGGTQTMLAHFKTLIRHPLYVLFLILYSVLTITFILYLLREFIFFKDVVASYNLLRDTTSMLLSLRIIGLYYGLIFLKSMVSKFYFILFSVPYTFSSIRESRHLYKILYAIPFSLIYWPAYSILSVIGIIKGVRAYRKFKPNERAW